MSELELREQLVLPLDLFGLLREMLLELDQVRAQLPGLRRALLLRRAQLLLQLLSVVFNRCRVVL